MAIQPKNNQSFSQKATAALAAAGVGRFQRKVSTSLWYTYYCLFRLRQNFAFQGKAYHYFYHKYNATWRNERVVEVPIIWETVKNFKGDVLEVGNVLSHYFPVNHDVVDKYEKAPRVVNEDVVAISLSKKYDLIVSISTLEHVGWDEEPKDSQKPSQAVKRLRALLTPKGRIVATMPLAYNPNLDALLKSGSIGFDKVLYLKRVAKDRWVEADWKEVENVKFNSPYTFANAIAVGIVET